MNSLGGFIGKAARLVTLNGNIGRCPDCGKVQFVDKIPELLKLEAGKWKNIVWSCTSCKCDMEYDGIITIPLNELNKKQ